MLEHFKNPDKVESPRKEVFYFSDDGDLTALRYGPWKIIFMEQREEGTMKVWSNPFITLRLPMILNVRRDPYEIAPITSNTYQSWALDRLYMLVPAQAYVGKFLSTYKEFPPRMKPATFSLGDALEKMTTPGNK